jgi:hypothetical protein
MTRWVEVKEVYMRHRFAWVLFAILLSCGVALAQSTLGTLLGTVTDPSGGVVPNATVKITNVDEGTSRTVTTDASGSYEAANSKPGHYTIEVTSPGFQTSRAENLGLVARQTLRVDVTLRVGQITQQVEVKAESVRVITTETEAVASTYETLQIINLPTNFRASGGGNSPYLLLSLLPGVQSDNSGNLTIQGGLRSQSQFTVDGISTTDVTTNAPLREAFPSAESLAEIKAQGVGSPAEFGNPGDVTTISKSGTNSLHGDVFWYHQNAALDAIAYGAKKKPAKVANDFGGSVGGPVVIPHVYNGRNKSFFFGTYERFHLPRTGVVQNTVPTQAMRDGDLSNFCTSGFDVSGICNDRDDSGNVVNQIYSPYTGVPYAGNVITDPVNSVSAKMLSLYPLPNQGTTFTSNNYNVNRTANYDSNTFDVRGDQYFGSKLSVFGRFSFKNITQLSPQELTFPSTSNYEHVRMLVTSATYTIRPTLLDEFRFGYTDDIGGWANPFDGRAFTNSLGLENISQNSFFNGVTEVDFSGITSSLDITRLNGNNQARTREFTNNLTWIKGRHTLKFGMDMRLIRAVTTLGFFGADNYGTFGFYGAFSGNDFADFLLGIPSESYLDNVTQDNDGRSRHWTAFAQDSFRVSPRLTLEYGVRWEYHPAYNDASGNIGNFDNRVPRSGRIVYPDGFASIVAQGYLQSFDACPNSDFPLTLSDPPEMNGAPCTPVVTASKAGLPQGLRAMSKTRFLPRFGFALKPFGNDKTVVRGGVGAYEAATLGGVYYSLTGTIQAYTDTYTNSLVSGAPLFVWPQTKTGGLGFGAPEYGTAYFGTANSVEWKDPYSLQWNLSVERNLGFSTGLRISYIGMKTTQLSWSPNWNQSLPNSTTPYPDQPLSSRPFPNWGRVNTRNVGSIANYNALQIEANRRFAGGLAFNSTYTWSKNLTDNLGDSANGGFCEERSCGRSSNWYDRHMEYGNSFGPRRHNWITTVVYQLPFGKGSRFAKTANPVLNGVIGGWQTSNIFLIQSGPWLTPLMGSGIDPSGTGAGFQGRSQHPDSVGPAYPGQQSSSQWFLSSGFQCPNGDCLVGTSAAHPPIGRFGTAGVGILEGPGTVSWNFAISKSFNLTERAKLRFEVSFVNVLNHINLGVPDMNITHPNDPATGQCGFGCITSAQGLFQFSGARTGQIGARIEF